VIAYTKAVVPPNVIYNQSYPTINDLHVVVQASSIKATAHPNVVVGYNPPFNAKAVLVHYTRSLATITNFKGVFKLCTSFGPD